MPLIERLLHSMLADDDVRPAFQSFGAACDSGLRLKIPHSRTHALLHSAPSART
ncbi:MAG: hypothetical protein WC340_01615 [Kiritimatiellia bacterium]